MRLNIEKQLTLTGTNYSILIAYMCQERKNLMSDCHYIKQVLLKITNCIKTLTRERERDEAYMLVVMLGFELKKNTSMNFSVLYNVYNKS